jgi:hypothetical protein
MGGKKNWTILSFLICFACNGALIVFFLTSRNLLGEMATAGALVLAGAGLTLTLWLLLLWAGRSLAQQIPVSQVPREVTPKRPPSPVPESRPSPEAAVQMLAALQREGRLIDFLQEEIASYDDGQIGAAVRNIHAGCKEALKESMEIEPVFQESEGATITVPAGFDARAIRLTGNVTGNPPFRGVLRHRGWKVERIRLPQFEEQKNHWILAPAEVEVE